MIVWDTQKMKMRALKRSYRYRWIRWGVVKKYQPRKDILGKICFCFSHLIIFFGIDGFPFSRSKHSYSAVSENSSTGDLVTNWLTGWMSPWHCGKTLQYLTCDPSDGETYTIQQKSKDKEHLQRAILETCRPFRHLITEWWEDMNRQKDKDILKTILKTCDHFW